MKTFTVVYLLAGRPPRMTYKQEYEAENSDIALHMFVNDSAHDNHFVAAIFEGQASQVSHTA